jgi:hypothetical protein
MSASYHLEVGKLECVVVADGSNDYRAELLFANASQEELRQALDKHGLGSEVLGIPYTCLAVKVNGEWMLVDTNLSHHRRYSMVLLEETYSGLTHVVPYGR